MNNHLSQSTVAASQRSGQRAIFSLLPVALLLIASVAQAQLYKWVGPDGKVNYTDSPPPASATKVEKKSVSGSNAADASLPYELADAARNNPVTLYTTSICAPCVDARALLRTRGIPYSEKTVNTAEDQAKLKQVSSQIQLPLLVVGRNKQPGYEAGAWNAALSAAAYPETNKLPPNYQFKTPEAAAGSTEIKAVAQKKAQAEPKDKLELKPPPPAEGNAPPGFQF